MCTRKGLGSLHTRCRKTVPCTGAESWAPWKWALPYPVSTRSIVASAQRVAEYIVSIFVDKGHFLQCFWPVHPKAQILETYNHQSYINRTVYTLKVVLTELWFRKTSPKKNIRIIWWIFCQQKLPLSGRCSLLRGQISKIEPCAEGSRTFCKVRGLHQRLSCSRCVGSDANPCSLSACPCRSLQASICLSHMFLQICCERSWNARFCRKCECWWEERNLHPITPRKQCRSFSVSTLRTMERSVKISFSVHSSTPSVNSAKP